MDVREKLVYLVKNALRTYGKDLGKIVEPYEFIADFLIHSGVTVQEWISVDDRLPEEKGRYLTANKRFGDETVVFDLWFGGGFWYVDEEDNVFDFEVTHWMPMPNPPNGE